MNVPWILASASPRRKELLAGVGLHPECRPVDIDETPLSGEMPVAYALRVARAKAAACPLNDSAGVLAADTVVAYSGRIYGKPKDAADAVRILTELGGVRHIVHTAVVVRHAAHPREWMELVSTEVELRALDEHTIKAYVATGEPLDKAGAYGIQGLGGALVAAVFGSYSNVIGLPVTETLRLLQHAELFTR